MFHICASFVLICFYTMHLRAPAFSLFVSMRYLQITILRKRWNFPNKVSGFGWAFHPIFATKNWQIGATPCAHPMQLDGSFFQRTTEETFVSQVFFIENHDLPNNCNHKRFHAGVQKHYLRLGSCFTLVGLGVSGFSDFSASFCNFFSLDLMWATNGLGCRSRKKT